MARTVADLSGGADDVVDDSAIALALGMRAKVGAMALGLAA